MFYITFQLGTTVLLTINTTVYCSQPVKNQLNQFSNFSSYFATSSSSTDCFVVAIVAAAHFAVEAVSEWIAARC